MEFLIYIQKLFKKEKLVSIQNEKQKKHEGHEELNNNQNKYSLINSIKLNMGKMVRYFMHIIFQQQRKVNARND